jgi:Ribbon-helix-helix protein, copG family
MKQSRTIADKSQKKMGRPRTVSKDGDALTASVRLTPKDLAVVDQYAAEMHVKRSEALRDMVRHAIDEWAKIKKRRKSP